LTVEEHLERGVVGGLGPGAKGDTGRAAAVAVASVQSVTVMR